MIQRDRSRISPHRTGTLLAEAAVGAGNAGQGGGQAWKLGGIVTLRTLGERIE